VVRPTSSSLWCGPYPGGAEAAILSSELAPAVLCRLAVRADPGGVMYHYSGPKYYTNPADPAREDDGLFGPGSVTWRVMGQRVMWVAGFRALYLQGLHPRVMRATWQNSSFADPAEAWGRLFRTRMFVLTRTFGTTAEAERAGRRVRKIHESISGTEPGGTSYRIDEPDLLLWVHNAEVASVIDVARRSGLPFSGAGPRCVCG
jgi:uncharacterized protein (DUF2236 family)